MSKAQIDTKAACEGRCRLCLRPLSVRALTRHRIVPGSVGGTYVTNNCVPLCRPCHDLVDNRDWKTRRIHRRMLRASLWPVEIAHARRYVPHWDSRGRDLRANWSFDDAYPRPTRELVLERRALVAL